MMLINSNTQYVNQTQIHISSSSTEDRVYATKVQTPIWVHKPSSQYSTSYTIRHVHVPIVQAVLVLLRVM